MKPSRPAPFSLVILAAALGGCSSPEEATPAPVPAAAPREARASGSAAPLSAEDAVLVTTTATVQAVDAANREVTLKGPLGNAISFVVDRRVRRLDEVKVGDEVTASYYVSVAGELRPPTEEEARHPVAMVEGMARAPKGTDPAAGGLRAIRVVTTVQGLDLPTRMVTLAGPAGNEVAIRARSLDNLKQLRLGDTIVVTYTEALAVALEKK